jgi:hypothetical protein
MCATAGALSWHDTHTAVIGDVLRLSDGSERDAPELVVVPAKPFGAGLLVVGVGVVGSAQMPVN